MAQEILPGGKKGPIGHHFVQCHMIFDVKMEDFRHTARLVAGCHMTNAPFTFTYANIVSRKTVRIALMTATLNDL